MARADPGTVVAVKIFVKLDEVAPVGIALEFIQAAINGSATRFVSKEDSDQPTRDICGCFLEIRKMPRPIRALGFEIISKEVVKLLERFNQQIIEREPNGAAPIRVSSEESAVRLRRLIIDPIFVPIDMEHIRMDPVELRKCADAVGSKEFPVVEKKSQNTG